MNPRPGQLGNGGPEFLHHGRRVLAMPRLGECLEHQRPERGGPTKPGRRGPRFGTPDTIGAGAIRAQPVITPIGTLAMNLAALRRDCLVHDGVAI